MILRRNRTPIAIVAEDEAVLRHELVSHLEKLWPELSIEGEAEDGIAALALIESIKPDVVFLDIQMPGLTGIDVARAIEGKSHIVFVTAYDSHAVAAFEQGAADYVLKPYDLARLAQAVARVRSKLEHEAPQSLERVLDEIAHLSAQKNPLRWIRASAGNDVRLILVDDVCYFQAETKYTTVATVDGDAIIRTSLKKLRDELDPDTFLSIHRSTIVNVNAIRKITRAMDGSMQILLKDRPERLSVSEANRHLFRMM